MGIREVVTVPIKAADAMNWRAMLDWHLSSFCRNGDTTPDRLLEEVARKKRQLWVGMRGEEILVAALTEVGPDLLQTFRVTHGAGEDRDSWVHLLGDLEAWAKSIGCKRMEVVARPGWERVLKDMKKTHVILEKRL